MNKCRKIGGRYVASVCNGAFEQWKVWWASRNSLVAQTQAAHQANRESAAHIHNSYHYVVHGSVPDHRWLNIRNLYPLYIHVHSGDPETNVDDLRQRQRYDRPSNLQKVDQKIQGEETNSSTGRLQSKRSKESSKGSDKAKALSNGGVCQPPTAPRKSGEIV